MCNPSFRPPYLLRQMIANAVFVRDSEAILRGSVTFFLCKLAV